MQSIIVFSHLRWNFVFQRPQHLLTRLAQQRQIFFIEEPVAGDTLNAFMQVNHPVSNITVYTPHTPAAAPGFSDSQLPYLHSLVNKLIRDERLENYVVWFYTPMALPLLQSLSPRAIIYDCMDELSLFDKAPRQLIQRETALMKCADLVLTGGPSLYEAKKDRHPNVHCFSSSVDVAHFANALDRAIETPVQAGLPGYRLGYFGVIDERLDLGLIENLARRQPEWQVIMVGPVVKISPRQLPQRDNIHYFGQQFYDELPKFLAGWDVCLMPFARNKATRFISPTKTLEYMAAEKPIVSTPITDVAALYSDIVYLGAGHDDFIDACEAALAASETETARRIARMRQVLAKTSWNSTASAISALINEAVQCKLDKASISAESPPDSLLSKKSLAVSSKTGSQGLKKTAHVIIGAGPTGLSAAYHLGADSLLLEQNSTVGGWCRSIQDQGFTFDYAGHIMFSNDDYVQQLYQKLLGDNIHWQNREAWVYSKNVYTRYPFQGALYGLPSQVIKECLIGAIESRYGSLKTAPASESVKKGKASDATACKSDSAITDCCADGLSEATAPLGIIKAFNGKTAEPRNFEEFIYQVWGAGIARHFAIPYNRKIWAVPLKEIETSWLGGRVPLPDLEEMIDGALSPVAKPMGPNARFGYPLRGGFQALMNSFLPHLQGGIQCNTRVAGVFPAKRAITLADGRKVQYKTLISTMPLPKLVELIGEEAPRDVQDAAKGLRHTSVRCVNIGIGRERFTDKHWIYYPEDSIFHRIFVQGNASPYCNPPGGFGFTCEITYSPYKPLPCTGEELIRLCINDAVKVGFIKADDKILTASEVDMPYAYVIYDHARAAHVETIRSWLLDSDIILSGRYSEWQYYNSDHAFLAGKKAAETVRAIERKLEKKQASYPA